MLRSPLTGLIYTEPGKSSSQEIGSLPTLEILKDDLFMFISEGYDSDVISLDCTSCTMVLLSSFRSCLIE